MGRRVGLLLIVLIIRLVVAGVMSEGCRSGEEVKVTGKLVRVDHNGANEIWVVGPFRGVMERFSSVDAGVQPGQVVAISGTCERGVIDFLENRVWLIDGEFIDVSNKGFEAKRGSGNFLVDLREKMVEIYQRQLPSPESELVAGIVLGAKGRLGKEFYDQLVKTGTVHVVVASGYNVTVVGMIIFNILVYGLVRKWASIGAVLGMVAYGVMAGGDPPVVRAVVMGATVFVARAYGRQSDSWWLLFLAAWGMVMWQPELIESVSFQLSVAATAGLMYVEPVVRGVFEGSVPSVRWVGRTELAPTLAAQITTTPIIWWHFGRVSLISPLVNTLVLPLVPLGMALGGAQGIFGLIWEPLGGMVAPFVYAVMHLFVVIVEMF